MNPSMRPWLTVLMIAPLCVAVTACQPDREEATIPIDQGVWDQVSEQYDCTSDAHLGTEAGEDIVCADAWNTYEAPGCGMTQSGNNYAVDCTVNFGTEECRVSAHLVGTVVITSRRHYTVDGTITINADPAGCWEESYSDEQEGCTRVHEVYTWREPLYDGACGGGLKVGHTEIADLKDPVSLFRRLMRQHLCEHVSVVGP